jgi:dienelactone hydrolase
MRWPIPTSQLASVLFVFFAVQGNTDASERGLVEGTVRFRPAGDEKKIPQRYRLREHTFDYQLTRKYDLPNAGVEVFRLQFPSPVVSKCPENNTVYAEYYRPKGVSRCPCVIVLDITGGDQSLSRNIATFLAQNRIGGLFVQMAYYGPRRPPGSKLRLLSTNIPQTMAAVRQTVLDLRWATAWMESRPEIDSQRLGILGTSLGSFMAALTAEMEPKLGRVAVLLGGGGLVDAYYDHPQAAPYRKLWEAVGGTKKQVAKLIAPVDPLTCAANLKDHQLLMIAGKRDEIVPPKATLALWKAAGEQKIVWYDCTHYGAALYFVPAMEQVVKHFGE